MQDQDLAAVYQKRALRERQAREAAESLLEAKSNELFEKNNALLVAREALKLQLIQTEIERDRVVELSKTDHLTQIANRPTTLKHLETQLQCEVESRRKCWLIVILLRRFKRVNLTVGQAGGDLILQKVADRLKRACRTCDALPGRFSGTEFAVVSSQNKAELLHLLSEIEGQLSKPFRYQERPVELDYTIVAVGSELAERSMENMRFAADYCLSKARQLGPRQVVVFDEELKTTLQEKVELERALKRAVRSGQIEPWFQPIVSCREKGSTGAEMLARWPLRDGMVPPSVFIPLATELGLMGQLDKQLLQSACQQSRGWILQGSLNSLSFNASPAQFNSTDFCGEIHETIRKAKFPAEKLVLEVSEEYFSEDRAFANQQLQRFREIGVKVALDDFGTGYSNLQSIVSLSLDTIKIDRSLIWSIESNTAAAMLVGAIIQWARGATVTIVAEGVETETQALLLRTFGCSSLQGYLYGAAMPARSFETSLEKLMAA